MSGGHVAVISRDASLTGEVRRLAALAGRAVMVAEQLAACARTCRGAALAVVDATADDLLDETVRLTNAVVVTDDPHRVAAWKLAVRVGARRVLTMPAETAELLDLLALAGELPGPAGPLVGVVGGCGGAGASMLTVALGWAFGQTGRAATVADFDVGGGGLDVLVGLEHIEGLRWGDLIDARGVVASSALREQLPTIGALAVLSTGTGPRTGDTDESRLPGRVAMTSVLAAARRGDGVVVADLPRHHDDEVCSVIANCDVLLLVLPAHVRSVAAAASMLQRLRPLCDDIRLVVRSDGRRRLHDRDIASALGVPHVATIRTESALIAAVERGQLVQSLHKSALGRAAVGLVSRLHLDVTQQVS